MSAPVLSVIVPAFNEVATIEAALQDVRKAPVSMSMEIVVVDDGSTDGTPDVVRRLVDGGWDGLRLVLHDVNRGKGAAVRSGFAHARGEIVLVQDADLEYDPRDYPLLLEPLLEDRADVVFGNRFHGGPHRALYFWHHVGNRALTLLTNVLTGLNLSDMEAGYKVFRADVLRRLTLVSDRFGFEPEVTIKVARLGCRIYEVPIRYHARTYDAGKKITWKDGVAGLVHILRFRFGA